jgi:hypothetical protein
MKPARFAIIVGEVGGFRLQVGENGFDRLAQAAVVDRGIAAGAAVE